MIIISVLNISSFLFGADNYTGRAGVGQIIPPIKHRFCKPFITVHRRSFEPHSTKLTEIKGKLRE
jgi:hypothetical protein